MTETSTVSVSPPTEVQARPRTTPTWLAKSLGSRRKRTGPRNVSRFLWVTVTRLRPSTTWRAALRQMRPISRSRERTPASRV